MCLSKVNAGSNGAERQFFFLSMSEAVEEESLGSVPFEGKTFILCMQAGFFFLTL